MAGIVVSIHILGFWYIILASKLISRKSSTRLGDTAPSVSGIQPSSCGSTSGFTSSAQQQHQPSTVRTSSRPSQNQPQDSHGSSLAEWAEFSSEAEPASSHKRPSDIDAESSLPKRSKVQHKESDRDKTYWEVRVDLLTENVARAKREVETLEKQLGEAIAMRNSFD